MVSVRCDPPTSASFSRSAGGLNVTVSWNQFEETMIKSFSVRLKQVGSSSWNEVCNIKTVHSYPCRSRSKEMLNLLTVTRCSCHGNCTPVSFTPWLSHLRGRQKNKLKTVTVLKLQVRSQKYFNCEQQKILIVLHIKVYVAAVFYLNVENTRRLHFWGTYLELKWIWICGGSALNCFLRRSGSVCKELENFRHFYSWVASSLRKLWM